MRIRKQYEIGEKVWLEHAYSHVPGVVVDVAECTMVMITLGWSRGEVKAAKDRYPKVSKRNTVFPGELEPSFRIITDGAITAKVLER